MISDQLGSTSTTANADGTWNSDIRYTAFGEIRLKTGVTATGYRYTGQLDMQGSIGLDYYVARFYDPQLGRFVQADSVIPGPGKSVSFDRYAYVKNNPILFNDPTGHKWVCTGANSDHCYEDGQGKASGMQTSVFEQMSRNMQYVYARHETSPLPNVSDSLNFSVPETSSTKIIQGTNPGNKATTPNLQFEFINPFRVDKLNGIGVSFALSGMLDIFGGQGSLDITYNWERQDMSIAIPFQFLAGPGFGISGTGSVIGLYNSDSVKDYWGGGIGGQGSIVADAGINAGYSRSWNPNKNGKTAQSWQAGVGLGAEASGSLVLGYTLPVVYIDFREKWPDMIKIMPN